MSRALPATRVDLEIAHAARVELAVDPLADAEPRCTLASLDLQDALDDSVALGAAPCRPVYDVPAVVMIPEARAGELLALACVSQAVFSAGHRLAVAPCGSSARCVSSQIPVCAGTSPRLRRLGGRTELDDLSQDRGCPSTSGPTPMVLHGYVRPE